MAAFRAKRRSTYRKKGARTTRSRGVRHRSYGRKRTYRKKASMSKRRILNTTSRKKRNGMLSWTSTPVNGTSTNVSPYAGPAYVSAAVSQPSLFLWNAIAQDMDSNSVVPNQSSRTATTCYMRGLSEHVRISTSTGLPWFHRRICFTTKFPFAPAPNAGASTSRSTFVDTSNGIERLWFNVSNNNDSVDIATVYSIIFRGASGADWNDPILAPTDPTRISVRFDKTWTYKSGNTVGTVRELKLWHGMNKNLVYDDDEIGSGEQPSYTSTPANPGMGNYFVVDIFSPLPGGSTGDIIRIDSNATLYWHER